MSNQETTMANLDPQIARSLRFSLCDGALATMMVSLAGGVFLVGFAMNVLGASTVQVGILAALPLSANLAQFLGSLILETLGRRRIVCILLATLSRLCWILIILLPLALFDGIGDARIWLLIVFVGFSSILGSMSGVAWLEWTSDVVPPSIRGSFFGKRNMIAAGAGMVAVLAGGYFLNRWELIRGPADPYGYMMLFGAGLLFGLLSSAALTQIIDPRQPATDTEQTFSWKRFAAPLQDANFRRLVFYVGAFMFVTQMAGPFYAVYMIDTLSIDFSTITWFITFATLASLFMLRIWGPIADEFGNRPILIVAGLAHALIPLSWVVAQSGAYFGPIAVAHVLSGMFHAAIVLAHLNILIKLSPDRGRSIYIAVFNGMIGLAVAVAPIVGGWFLDLTQGVQFTAGNWEINHLHLLFLVSGGLQIGVLFMLFSIHEEGAAPSRAVLLQLRNDLDPQTGIAGVSDLVSVKAARTGNLLRLWDSRTDAWVARSEARIARSLDRIENKWRVFSKTKRFLREI